MHDFRGFEADLFSTRGEPNCPSLRVSNINGLSKLARFSLNGMAPVLVPLRPSSEITDAPSKLARYLSRDGD
jgi:hypothetical protein